MNLGAPVLLSFSLLFLLRFRSDFNGAIHDVKWIAFLSLWIYRGPLREAATAMLALFRDYPALSCFSALLLPLSYVSSFLFPKGILTLTSEKTDQSRNDLDIPFMKPLIFPCKTSHTRLFPKKHSFSYSYLFVGVPVGWRGSIGSLLSADTDSIENNGSHRNRGWFSVEGADYLHRGYDVRGLRGKLVAYLELQVCQGLKY